MAAQAITWCEFISIVMSSTDDVLHKMEYSINIFNLNLLWMRFNDVKKSQWRK